MSGRREGEGIFYFSDGSRYEGAWLKDKEEGQVRRHTKPLTRRLTGT